ncbi:MAG: DUF1533 domain-containing protein, partial [Oscillospiraceae bacterium]|nr:DUF1533 domain-containing protein [Oscillospiraceae bacterium]
INNNGGGGSSFAVNDGVAAVNVTALAANPWNVELGTVFPVQENFTYRVTFEARAANPRNIQVVVEHLPFGGRRIEPTVPVTTEWQTFSFEWSEGETRDLGLRFHMGQQAGAATGLVELRNVNVYVPAGAPFVSQIPTFVPATNNIELGNPITLLYNAAFDPAFSALGGQRVLYVDGVAATFTSPTPGTIVLAANNFTADGSHTIRVTAPGYETIEFTQIILAGIPDDNLVVNGNFALPFGPSGGLVPPYTWFDDINGWCFYLQSITAELDFPSGDGVSIYFPGGASQTPVGAMWHVQLRQRNNNNITAGNEYRFIMEARSTVDRNIWLGLIGAADAAATRSVVPLTQEWTTYERIFTGPLMPATGANARSIQFFMGATAADPWFDTAHTIDIRSIRIEPVIDEPPPGGDAVNENNDFSLPIAWTPSPDWVWAGSNGWQLMRASGGAIPTAATGPDGLALTMLPGASDWFVQMSTQNRDPSPVGQVINLGGQPHYVIIEARASEPRPILAAITAGGNGRNVMNLTTEWQTFTFPASSLFNNRITFYLGGGVAPIFNPTVPVPLTQHTIYFREVSVVPAD